MVGKRQAPEWYVPEAYHAAEALDEGDWLLNLTLRNWLHREAQPRTEEALRRVGPVLRREDDTQIKQMHLADVHRWVHKFKEFEWDDDWDSFEEARDRPTLPAYVWNALQTGAVRSGIEPLRVSELYVFEKMLPEELRERGVRPQGGDQWSSGPPAFEGRLDHAFPKPMLNRFVRINLALPVDVLRADLEAFIATEREDLAKRGGEQPYRAAADLKLKVHSLQTLANVGLLQFLDLDRWQRAQGLDLSVYAVREMAGVADRSREDELLHRVKLTQSQMQLHAWFARLDRGGGRARRSS